MAQGGWNKNKYNKTGINEAKRRLAPLKTQLRSLKADIALLQQCVQVRCMQIFLGAQIFLNGQTSTDDPNWASVCVEPPGERRGKRLPVMDRTTTSLNLDTFWAATQYLTVQVCSNEDTYYVLLLYFPGPVRARPPDQLHPVQRPLRRLHHRHHRHHRQRRRHRVRTAY